MLRVLVGLGFVCVFGLDFVLFALGLFFFPFLICNSAFCRAQIKFCQLC